MDVQSNENAALFNVRIAEHHTLQSHTKRLQLALKRLAELRIVVVLNVGHAKVLSSCLAYERFRLSHNLCEPSRAKFA